MKRQKGNIQVKTDHVKEEFYRKPGNPRTIIIPPDIWTLDECAAIQHINPIIIKKGQKRLLPNTSKEIILGALSIHI